jgi:hypothetical protein
MARLGLIAALLGWACGSDGGKANGGDTAGTDDGPWRPDLVCPGDAGCASGDGQLEAGAAAVSITPECFEQWLDCGRDGICPGDEAWTEADQGEGDAEWHRSSEPFLDCGCDQLCEGDEGYPGADQGEEDGTFQAAWLAGFQNGRPANSVHDDIWSRTVVLRQGDTTVALVSLDVVGFFYDDVEEVRAKVDAEGLDVDHVMISATHNHEAPDTLGQWGQMVGKRGVDEAWMAELKERVVDSIAEAVQGLTPVDMTAAMADLSTVVPEKGTRNFINDKRDPRIVDEAMGVVVFRAQDDGRTVATIVNQGNHPEALADENTAITSDFAHYVRDGMENGVPWESGAVDGLGGVSVYLQGAVGGMMTPLGVEVTDHDGGTHSASDFAKAQALGHMMATAGLEALDGADVVADPSLKVTVARMTFPIDNTAFQAMFLMGVFEREAFNYDPDEPLDDYNVPELATEVNVIDVGPIRMLTVPGEILPELAIGGFDGSHTQIGEYTDPIVDLERDNAADLSLAPEGPFLKEQMGAEMNWIIGLGNDELGYIIPEYNFILDDRVPYLVEASGDHYEETNSLGPRTAPLLMEWADRLLTWNPEG